MNALIFRECGKKENRNKTEKNARNRKRKIRVKQNEKIVINMYEN